MPVVRANGLDIHYDDSRGDGVPVVLIHGHSVDLRMWPAQMLALRRAGYRVIRYDVRGHGRTTAPPAGYHWTDHAADLRGLLDALDIARAHLVGFSMGGGIALEFALDNPGRVHSVTLIATTIPGFAYSDEFAATIEALVTAVRAEGWRPAAERLWLPQPMFNGVRRHPAAFEVVRELVLAYPARDYLVDAVDPPGAVEAIERLEELRAPALVIVGEDDLDDFLLAAKVLAENVPRVRLELVPGAGHLVPLERPDRVNALLLDFLARLDAPPWTLRRAAQADEAALSAIDGSFERSRVVQIEQHGAFPSMRFDLRIATVPKGVTAGHPRTPDYWHKASLSGWIVVVAELEGSIVGVAACRPDEDAALVHLTDLRVQPTARRRGIGRALLEAAAAAASKAGAWQARALAPANNPDYVQFLLAAGFEISGVEAGVPSAEADDRPAMLLLTASLSAG